MLSLVIQAGGLSKRMGRNKALLLFRGEPLIKRLIRRFQNLADEIWVSTNQVEELSFIQVPLKPDEIAGQGVIGGLYTSLLYSRYPYVGAIACDMPFANPWLLAEQVRRMEECGADVVVPATPAGLEPLHAVYRRSSCLQPVLQAIQNGQPRLIGWFPSVRVEVLRIEQILPFDPYLYAFINLNTPEELERAERIAEDE